MFYKSFLKRFKRQKRTVLKNIKGSCKNPFFYLGAFSVLLLGIVVFVPSFLATNTSVALTAIPTIVPQQTITNDSFVGQGETNKIESPDFSLVQGDSVSGLTIPLAVSPSVLGSLIGDSASGRGNAVAEYQVEGGDTLKSIADQFSISLNTLLWANNLKSSSSVKPGQTLIILPVDGVLHYVKDGDTLTSIAKKYKADVNAIMVFNELTDSSDITVGDILIVPDGVMPASAAPSMPTSYGSIPVSSGYFISPIGPNYKKTQGLHFYNAVDITNGVCGTPIYASAGGTVTKVSSGWNGGAGNTVKIMHPNGVATSCGHMMSFIVKVGDQVSQGQIIGYMGGKPGMVGAGKSTGCHVHFAFYGIANPFAR